MNWFGNIPMPGVEIPVPLGAFCTHCAEPIAATDSGIRYPDQAHAHRSCFLRQILGSAAHIEKRCGCYVPGSLASDDEALSKRQAAEAAVAAWDRKQRLQVN